MTLRSQLFSTRWSASLPDGREWGYCSVVAATEVRGNTRELVLDAALASFGTAGYDGTSLDDLAAGLGIRKQTILYHFVSKRRLLDAVVDRCAGELVAALERALAQSRAGGSGDWERVEAMVREVFRLALDQPVLLGLLREVSRPNSPGAVRVRSHLEPLMARARRWMEDEMAAGRMRRTDAQLLLLSAYSTVVGVATEIEVLRAAGVGPTLRPVVQRRGELLRFLRRSLDPAART
jgi:TetR/AcrR family transcriptional regulator